MGINSILQYEHSVGGQWISTVYFNMNGILPETKNSSTHQHPKVACCTLKR